jgi:hypothetical protein
MAFLTAFGILTRMVTTVDPDTNLMSSVDTAGPWRSRASANAKRSSCKYLGVTTDSGIFKEMGTSMNAKRVSVFVNAEEIPSNTTTSKRCSAALNGLAIIV